VAGTITVVEQHEQPGPVLTEDERHLVLSAHALGLLRSSRWPDVAAQLLVRGVDGEATVTLAGLSSHDSPWTIDPLVPDVVAELTRDPQPGLEDGSRLVGRAVARAAARAGRTESFAAVRALAALSPRLDYPGGIIGEAYYASEWLDCGCHYGSAERAAAEVLEAALRDEPLDVADDLLTAVTRGWV
jgi:hypothetical protein